MESELVKLIEHFEGSETIEEAIQNGIRFLKTFKGSRSRLESCHSALCLAMFTTSSKTWSQSAYDLLHHCGTLQTLSVVYNNIAQAERSAALWLSQEIVDLLEKGRLTALIREQLGHTPLTAEQEHLVGVVSHLPDRLANRLGRQLPLSLLPVQYFETIGRIVADCLKYVASTPSKAEGVVFLSALLGKATVLGQRGVLLGPIRLLAGHVTDEPVWRSISHSLFSHLPTSCLESVLETLISTLSPSLQPSLVHAMLGNLVVKNHRAKFILTHKLILVRVPSSSSALYNLIGYLWSCDVLGACLEVALGVWSDSSALRHMPQRQHSWLSSVLMLGVNCLRETNKLEELKPELQRLTMAGVEAHIGNPTEGVRQLGMVVGQYLMNALYPLDSNERLEFDYRETDDVRSVLKLGRPVSEIQKELAELCVKSEGSVSCEESVSSEGGEGRYGEGTVTTLDCSDNDSDDDIQPYDMSDDPVHNVPRPPQYLHTLVQGLLATKEPLKVEVSLRAAEDIIRREPSNLSEVCVQLTKILLHMSDEFALPDFVSQRLNALIAICVLCPKLTAPYLTTEFYAPNYNLRQRMDVLEVLARSALELSQPRSPGSSGGGASSTPLPVRKPWEEVIQERLKTKTRIISKGRTRPPPTAAPNRFADVATLFFFPLMSSYDQPQGTLKLLEQDSLVLGNLLYTLGTVMHSATHTQPAHAMGVALLDFTWALRYHNSVYVRQGVLYCLAMLVSGIPGHTLPSLMEGGLLEAIQWTKDIATEDPDAQCRTLAGHVISSFQSKLKESTAGDAGVLEQ